MKRKKDNEDQGLCLPSVKRTPGAEGISPSSLGGQGFSGVNRVQKFRKSLIGNNDLWTLSRAGGKVQSARDISRVLLHNLENQGEIAACDSNIISAFMISCACFWAHVALIRQCRATSESKWKIHCSCSRWIPRPE